MRTSKSSDAGADISEPARRGWMLGLFKPFWKEEEGVVG